MTVAQKEKTQRDIITASREVFARKGYHKAKVSEIADRSGVGKGTIYRYFNTKAELFASMVDDVSAEMARRVKESLGETESPVKQLEIICDAHMDLFEQKLSIFGILVNEGLEPTGIKKHDVVSRWDRYLGIVEDAFIRGREQVVFSCKDPKKAARIFISALWGLLRNAIIFNVEDPRNEYGDEFLRIFLEGV